MHVAGRWPRATAPCAAPWSCLQSTHCRGWGHLMGIRNVAAAVLLALLAAGCAQPEERINAALPVAAAIEQARVGLLQTARDQGMDAGRLQAEYDRRMLARAAECGHGLAPGLFSGEADI